jgi:hypothetical protein
MMALRSKPKQRPAADEHRKKGGTVPADNKADKSKPMLVQLRLSRDLIQRIDRSRKKRTVPPSRHSWILEALLDKLKAEH